MTLADFSLVRPVGAADGGMTSRGQVLGSPQYMSPEQCRSELADERSDVYAMGATYFALLVGRPRYPGAAPLLVMNAHLSQPVPDPSSVDLTIPPACGEIVRRAMAKDPDDRHPSALALLAELEAALRRRSPDCRRSSVGVCREGRSRTARTGRRPASFRLRTASELLIRLRACPLGR